MIGLMIALIEWEMLYPLHGSSTDLAQSNVFSQWIIVMTSVLGVLAIIIKYRMEATWRHYDNPMKFYRKLVRQQVDVGLLEEEAMKTDLVKRGNPFMWMMRRPLFWFEMIIMCTIPIPLKN